MNDSLDYSHSSDRDTRPTTSSRIWTVVLRNKADARKTETILNVKAPINSKAWKAALVIAAERGINTDDYTVWTVREQAGEL